MTADAFSQESLDGLAHLRVRPSLALSARASEHLRNDPDTYAEAGEWVTCENGHRICQTVERIEKNSRIRSSAFSDWQQVVPTKGSRPTCAICGGRFYAAYMGLTGVLHFEQGWRVMGRHYDELPEMVAETSAL